MAKRGKRRRQRLRSKHFAYASSEMSGELEHAREEQVGNPSDQVEKEASTSVAETKANQEDNASLRMSNSLSK